MSNLVNIIEGKVVVSSRQVAEKFEREHRNVTASIREILGAEKLASSLFTETTFEYRGQDFTEYIMNRDGFSLLVMGFTGAKALSWKMKYINAFNEMENQLRQPTALPRTYKEALVSLLASVEDNERLAAINVINAPKADFYDTVTQSETHMDFQAVAGILAIKGLGRNNLIKTLVAKGILIDSKTPYRTQVDNGNFKIVESSYENRGSIVISRKVVVSQKGIDYIRKLCVTQKAVGV